MSIMRAKGTLANYNTALRRFQEFCEGRQYSHHEITEQVVIHYLAELNKQQVSYAVLCQVKPALVMMEEISGKWTAFTARADKMMEGAKRIAAERREPVKKATEVDLELLKNAVEKYITSHSENIHRIDVYKFRTIYRLVLEYLTLCRFSNYNKLQARHMRKMGNNVEVVFRSLKNNQTGVYILAKKLYLFPPPSENDIFSPSLDTSFFDSHRGLFSLILPYFAFILPFYFPFYHFL